MSWSLEHSEFVTPYMLDMAANRTIGGADPDDTKRSIFPWSVSQDNYARAINGALSERGWLGERRGYARLARAERGRHGSAAAPGAYRFYDRSDPGLVGGLKFRERMLAAHRPYVVYDAILRFADRVNQVIYRESPI